MGNLFGGAPKAPDNSALIQAQRQQQMDMEKQQAELQKRKEDTLAQTTADINKRRRNQTGRSLLMAEDTADTSTSKATKLG